MSRHIHITQCRDKNEALEKSARDLLAIVLKLKHKNKPVLLLLSGGSALAIVNQVNTEIFDRRVTIGVLDERYSTDEHINNFRLLTQTKTYTIIEQRGCPIIDSRVRSDESQEELAQRIEKDLRAWVRDNKDGAIVVTQGIGPDGHTSGIMPFPEDPKRFQKMFNDEKIWIQAYDATGKNAYPKRVTTTLPFMRMVNHSILFACGQDKLKALHDSLSNKNTASTPACIINEMKDVRIFTDLPI
ncbi:MAG: 6-phosphogluconolactonase [Candidatus Taylorbacteria bacterium]